MVPPTPSPRQDVFTPSMIETSLNLRRTAFIFLNLQSCYLELLPRETAHQLLMSIFMLRDSLDLRRSRPVVVHIVSLSPTFSPHFPSSCSPREGEPVLAKPGLSAFFHTGLERHLRERRVERVYLCGVSSGAEMVATALAARDVVGEKVWVVEDCWEEDDPEHGDASLDLLAGLDMLVDVQMIEGLREERLDEVPREKESGVKRELERREKKREERERKERLNEGDSLARRPAMSKSPREAGFGDVLKNAERPAMIKLPREAGFGDVLKNAEKTSNGARLVPKRNMASLRPWS